MSFEDFDFRNPDYDAVSRARMDRLDYVISEKKVDELKHYYKTHLDDFINDWGFTLDPRNKDLIDEETGKDRPALIPFVLFPRQRDYVNWVVDKWRKRKDGICVKSRDMGVSWLSAAVAASFILLYEDFIFGFGSRKEEYVDSSTPKSLFWKIRNYIAYLPPIFRPKNLVTTHMRIENRDLNSWITGEAGDNIGRGDRASIYVVDEAAFVEHQAKADAALSQTSNCKLWVSTINEPGDAFHQKQISGEFDVFEFDWRDDPRKDPEWYQEQKRKYKHDPILIAREIDRDYEASTGDSWISAGMVERAQNTPPNSINQDMGQGIILGVDAGHMGDDESILNPRCGRISFAQKIFLKLDGPALALEVVNYCKNSKIPVIAIVIELDGPGVSCYDCLKNNEEFADILFGVHTGVQYSTGPDYNLRARMYRRGKEWLDDLPCSMPNDLILRTQISSVKYSYRLGQLLLMSKKDMRAKGFKSPDRSDGWVLTFAVDESMIRKKKMKNSQVPPTKHHW